MALRDMRCQCPRCKVTGGCDRSGYSHRWFGKRNVLLCRRCYGDYCRPPDEIKRVKISVEESPVSTKVSIPPSVWAAAARVAGGQRKRSKLVTDLLKAYIEEMDVQPAVKVAQKVIDRRNNA